MPPNLDSKNFTRSWRLRTTLEIRRRSVFEVKLSQGSSKILVQGNADRVTRIENALLASVLAVRAWTASVALYYIQRYSVPGGTLAFL